ncbi:MAG: hypothetical protein AAGC60_19945 [Acidobacteriota bacterium]
MNESSTNHPSTLDDDEPALGETRSQPPKHLPLVAGGFLYAAVIAAIYLWFSRVQAVGTALSRLDSTWAQFLQYDQPEFWSGFRSGIHLYLSKPRWLLTWMVSEPEGLALTAVLVGLGIFWWTVSRYRTTRFIRWAPVTSPLWFGLALYPNAAPRVFRVLAEAGVTLPSAVGSGLGEKTFLVFVGLVATLGSVGIALWLGRRDADSN